jgi:hypothetical protein
VVALEKNAANIFICHTDQGAGSALTAQRTVYKIMKHRNNHLLHRSGSWGRISLGRIVYKIMKHHNFHIHLPHQSGGRVCTSLHSIVHKIRDNLVPGVKNDFL